MNPWPTVFELAVGESTCVELPDGQHTVTLRDVTHTWEPDAWIEDNPDRRTLRAAQIHVEVDGEDAVLTHQPYALPTRVGDLRLYVETTKTWATACTFESLSIDKDVRFSAQMPRGAWGPEAVRFPILSYRWRSASYNNTWGALVPYNLLYYHRGEDFGAIPDQLPVVAILDGTIVQSPVPAAQGSNSLAIRSPLGLVMHYAHMNIETIDPVLKTGATVAAGQVLGKTGCTWSGHRSQWADPHLHVAFTRIVRDARIPVSPYPFLVEAYLRAYPDVILPVAGGYHFTRVGTPVMLDATRSVTRAGHRIAATRWELHDGRICSAPTVEVTYDRPGQYAETLVVTTVAEDGSGERHEARDFASVRVYSAAADETADSQSQSGLAFGWVYASPVRDIKPETPVRFWNRLMNTHGDVTIDYGDGSPVQPVADESWHVYGALGLYTVSVSAGTDGQGKSMPVTSRICIEIAV